MKCAVHTDVDATGYCRHCGRPLCPPCTRDVRGALYCEDCLSRIVFGAAPGAQPAPSTPDAFGPALANKTTRPGVALFLGFIPGLGAVYNGEYIKALIHVCIFGALIAGASSDLPDAFRPLFALAIACFYFYMPIEAFRTAKAREAGGPVQSDILPWEGPDGRVPTGPIILIGLGVLLLFANLGLFRWLWFSRLWPLGLIALGIWILYGRVRQSY